jgi:hypothetical protein
LIGGGELKRMSSVSLMAGGAVRVLLLILATCPGHRHSTWGRMLAGVPVHETKQWLPHERQHYRGYTHVQE